MQAQTIDQVIQAPLHGLMAEAAKWIEAKESTDVRYNIQVVGE